jgi:hypothetical protein
MAESPSTVMAATNFTGRLIAFDARIDGSLILCLGRANGNNAMSDSRLRALGANSGPQLLTSALGSFIMDLSGWALGPVFFLWFAPIPARATSPAFSENHFASDRLSSKEPMD